MDHCEVAPNELLAERSRGAEIENMQLQKEKREGRVSTQNEAKEEESGNSSVYIGVPSFVRDCRKSWPSLDLFA